MRVIIFLKFFNQQQNFSNIIIFFVKKSETYVSFQCPSWRTKYCAQNILIVFGRSQKTCASWRFIFGLKLIIIFCSTIVHYHQSPYVLLSSQSLFTEKKPVRRMIIIDIGNLIKSSLNPSTPSFQIYS